ncbi:hypothetical protein V500_10571 [Pseudogymnoascus sp. VKM F-4518 (FW-2643)]|nr:hypothetical protein V500_10571 [Pseudogymnoascus sp. VKM F-4518 (FW-2643)]
MPSFTPVNQPVRSSWGKNSDALYDIPQDDDPLPVSQLPQKRKRRSTASTRNKSTPTAHMKKARRKDDSPLSKRFAYISASDEQTSPQPSLQLDPKISASRRTNSALSKQTKVFPNTGISKPNAQRSYDNKAHQKQSTEFTINAPSTLDRVTQAGHIGLAQTTLEKLATFRFKQSAVDDELNKATSRTPRTDTANLGTHQFAQEQSIENGGGDIYPVPVPDDALSAAEYEVYEDVSHQTHARARLEEPEDDFYDLFDETANISCSKEASDYGNTYVGVGNDMSKQDHLDTLEGSSSIYRDSAIGTETGDLSNAKDHAETSQGWEEGLDDEDFAQLDIDDLALPKALATPHMLPQTSSVQFPVERKSDDFDDGVADDDLMEIMVEYENVHDNYAGHKASKHVNNNVETIAEFENGSHSSLRLQSTDDEYFMDDTDEAELANLAEQSNPIIIETHSAPSNWTQSDVRSRDREVYDEKLNYSSPSIKQDDNIININQLRIQPSIESLAEPEDWSFLNHNPPVPENSYSLRNETLPTALPMTPGPCSRRSANDDSHEYIPLSPFARSPFPEKVCGGSLIPGLTTSTILRTCFRIGECIRAGSFCNRLNQDSIIELFCRVTFSSREDGTHKQIFQFADIFHNSPPFVNGVLANYRVSALQETESRELLTGNREVPGMVRCLGRLRTQVGGNGWVLHLDNIRQSDWEEVRWTRRIVGVQGAQKDRE